MIGKANFLKVGLVGAALALCFVTPASAQLAKLSALSGIEAGEWQLRYRDTGEVRKLCVPDGRAFIRLQHRTAKCDDFVVENTAKEATVHYTCPGKGFGRTTVKRENSRLVQVRSHGIANDIPFEFFAEARRIGSCR